MTMLSPVIFQIEETIPELDGWCTSQRASEYAAIIVGLKPKVTVCIGVWGGRDVYAMALAHKYNGFGKVLAIDPWLASKSVEGQTGENATWWASQQRHDQVYNSFLTHLAQLELGDWVEVHRKAASEVPVPNEIGLLVVDGNHGPEAIKDVERWAPAVNVGSCIYADDLNWEGGAVQEAVKRLLNMGFVMLYTRDTGAFFQRVRMPAPAIEAPKEIRIIKSKHSSKRG